MNNQRGFTLPQLLFLLIVLFGVGGWIANIVKLIGMNLDPITGMLIVRAVGIVLLPVGAVVGFIPN